MSGPTPPVGKMTSEPPTSALIRVLLPTPDWPKKQAAISVPASVAICSRREACESKLESRSVESWPITFRASVLYHSIRAATSLRVSCIGVKLDPLLAANSITPLYCLLQIHPHVRRLAPRLGTAFAKGWADGIDKSRLRWEVIPLLYGTWRDLALDARGEPADHPRDRRRQSRQFRKQSSAVAYNKAFTLKCRPYYLGQKCGHEDSLGK